MYVVGMHVPCIYNSLLSGHPVYTFIHDNKREQRQNLQVSVDY